MRRLITAVLTATVLAGATVTVTTPASAQPGWHRHHWRHWGHRHYWRHHCWWRHGYRVCRRW
jgi:Spy/CpxP family protein refolding chaperone